MNAGPMPIALTPARLALDEALRKVEGKVPCAPDPEPWHSVSPAARRAAAAACSRCPVTAPCLAYALDHDSSWGVWGARDFQATAEREHAQEQTTDTEDAA